MGSVLGRGHHHGCEGVIDHQLDPMFIGDLCQFGDIADLEHGVGHCFGVNDFRVRPDGFAHIIQFGYIHEGDINIELLKVIVQESKSPAIYSHGADHMVPAVDQLEDRTGNGRHSGSGNPGRFCTFKCSQGIGKVFVRRVPVTGVEVATLLLACEGFAHGNGLHEGVGG